MTFAVAVLLSLFANFVGAAFLRPSPLDLLFVFLPLWVSGPILGTMEGVAHRNPTLVLLGLVGWCAIPATVRYFVRPARHTWLLMASSWLLWFASGTALVYWVIGHAG
jgi:hypothetical protein